MDVTRNRYWGWDGLITLMSCIGIGAVSHQLQAPLYPGLAWRPEAGWVLALLLLRPPSSRSWVLGGAWMAGLLLHLRFQPGFGAWGAISLTTLETLAAGLSSLVLNRWAGPSPDFQRLRGVRILVYFPCFLIALA